SSWTGPCSPGRPHRPDAAGHDPPPPPPPPPPPRPPTPPRGAGAPTPRVLARAAIVQAGCHGTDNAALLDALRRGGGRHAGVAMIDAATPDAELDALHEAGVRGTRVNFVAHLG